MSAAAQLARVAADDFYAVAPNGRTVRISEALFRALTDHLEGKISGVIEIHTVNGGIANVEGTRRYK